jgi:hypothetical protein
MFGSSVIARSPIIRSPAISGMRGMMSTTALDSRCSSVICLPIANIVILHVFGHLPELLFIRCEHVVVLHGPRGELLVLHHH